MDSDRGPVLVTGAHRSGTTVLGDVVARSPGSWTVWEPFNQHWGLSAVSRAYPYLDATSSDLAPVAALERYLATGRGCWSAKPRWGPVGTRVRAARRSRTRQRLWRQNNKRTPVVKDPFALLALGSMQPRITRRPVIVSVRHPGAWVMSLSRMSWPAGQELNALIAQRDLYDRFLADLLPVRDWTTADDITAGALAWRCLYGMLLEQVRAGAVALVVPLESFSHDPVTVMRLMFGTLGLSQPEDLESLAAEYTKSDTVVPDDRTKHVLQRDSKALSGAWRGRLTKAETSTIRSITEPVYAELYPDWESATAEPQLLGRRLGGEA
jgi:hypothetical protein